MQCKYCDRQVYVSQICPHCQDYYCIDHSEPIAHNCPSHQQPQQPTVKLQPTTKLEEPQKHLLTTGAVLKSLFPLTLLLVIFEEVLRQISYVEYSPLFEPNVYVAMLSQHVTPYIASSIILITVCTILFAANKLASKIQNNDRNSQVKLLKKAIPFGVYAIVIIVYIPAVLQWLLLLT
jgi:hypothetical protein